MIEWQQFWQVKYKGDLPERAYDQKPDLDYPLQEALSGFYFMSDRRKVQVGMSAVVPEPLQLSEMATYYDIFQPILPLTHFIRILCSADRTYLNILRDSNKNIKPTKAKR